MLELFAWTIALPPLLVLLIFTAEVLAGLSPLKLSHPSTHHTTAAVIVPSHNEEAIIQSTVRELKAVLAPGWRLLVVADNCRDATADLARSAGAEVIERVDPENRGKGFALDFGRAHLASDPPSIVVIIDADCTTDRQSMELLVSSAHHLNRPVQAVNLVTAPRNSQPLVQISNFAMLIKNLVRARGLYRMAGGIPLFGTGMALPWPIFAQAKLASAETVEDLRLSLDLAHDRIAVNFVEGAKVLSPAATAEDMVGQRSRWEHGFLRIAFGAAIPTLWRGLRQGSRHLIGLGMHLCVPPLALLLLIACGCLLLAALMGFATSNWMPAILLLGGTLIALFVTFLAWMLEGRETLTFSALTKSPFYVLSKLRIYLRFFINRHSAWNRTPRRSDRP